MSVWEAQRKINAREFIQWQIYYEMEPFGEIREDIRNAQLCCLTYNIWRGKKSAKTIEDFMLKTGDRTPKRKVTGKEMEAKLLLFTMAKGGKVIGYGNNSVNRS